MNWTHGCRIAAFAVAALLVTAQASAQIIQSVQFGVGRFLPRGFDSRDIADTIAADLTADDPLKFGISDFNSGHFFGEWNMQMGKLEVGAGIGYYRSKRVSSTYRDLLGPGQSEIRQQLRLKITPLTTVVRLIPFGGPTTVQPYVGGGVGWYKWQYDESGQFVAPDHDIFTDAFSAKGTSFGQIFLLGLRVPASGNSSIAMEWRYQFSVGRTGGLANGFLGEKIDLSGGTFSIGFLGRF